MNKLILGLVCILLGLGVSYSQDLSPHEVPSVIINHFQQEFPKAKDIDWELKGDFYEVEFEVDWPSKDHEIWYDKNGTVIRHKQEISKSDLPDAISEILKRDYKWYRIKDVKKIEKEGKTTYSLEAKSLTEEWELVYDENGKELQKTRD